ncbi:hypothetical protein HAZT_HAZT004426 [Hyalella azteca]|uniref:Homeobox domain-containing protein n=1 Tax=Hyalella azteca TaxID=294128 RepID=A0A6A0H6D0_HYAAZ|nr:hypothetical protein HAZT_HAZT004426 [Hyalella azteca]
MVSSRPYPAQVSTWFANARRRIKKEKKISWDTKSNADEDDDDEEEHAKDDDRDASKKAILLYTVQWYTSGAFFRRSNLVVHCTVVHIRSLL